MTTPCVVVLVIDRLGSAHLGPFGNTWLDTPAWNRLAHESLLFEMAQVDSPHLELVYRGYWQGLPSICPPALSGKSLPDALREVSLHSTLLTDSAQVKELPTAASFGEQIVVPVRQPRAPRERVEQTQFARLIAAALEVLSRDRPPDLLWIHAQAMQGPWDAPLELRAQFSDAEDPDPDPTLVAPDQDLGPDPDPDRLLSLTHAYAGQVCVIDLCLEPLLEAVSELPDAAFLVTSCRGFALGEHGRVGASGDDLYAEVLQVPMLLRLPRGAHRSLRTQSLVQPADVFVALRQLLLDERPQSGAARLLGSPADDEPQQETANYVASVLRPGGDPQYALRTAHWFLRDGTPPALYAKPDDRFEVNEVANRCASEVVLLQQFLSRVVQISQSGGRESFPPLNLDLKAGN